MTLFAVSCYDKEIEAINQRLDDIENVSIATLNQQVASITISISNLEETDRELKGYITNLQNTATELQRSINSTNDKIDRVESDLRTDLDEKSTKLSGDILAAKTELIAELETLRSDTQGKLNQINTAISALQSADVTLGQRIDALKTYTDTEIRDAKNWASATFSTLDQYNQTVEEIAGIKSNITAINTAISELETRLNSKIATAIAQAVSTLEGELQQQAADITQAYKDAIAQAKGEIESAYTMAIATAIASSESSMKAWVNGRLTGYYTIAETDAKLLALQQNLEGQLGTQKTYFETMINSLSGQLNNKIQANTTAIEELRGQIAGINHKQDSLCNVVANNVESIQGNARLISENAQNILQNSNDITELRQLIAANKAGVEENTRLIEALDETVRTANLSISAQDVVKNAQDIATNAGLIAQNAQGIADNASAIQANATDIATLRSDLETAKSDLTTAYQSAIETAINNLDGKLSIQMTTQINSAISDLESRINGRIATLIDRIDAIDAEIETINGKIANIISDIAAINDRLDALINRIQSITFVPEYTDGKCRTSYDLAEDGSYNVSIVIDIEILPHSAAEGILSNPGILSAEGITTITKSNARITALYLKNVELLEPGLLRTTFDYSEAFNSLTVSDNPMVSVLLSSANSIRQTEYIPVDIRFPFTDSTVESILINHYDENNDGVLSFLELQEISDLGSIFTSSAIKSFPEFKFLTKITEISGEEFKGCNKLTYIIIPSTVRTISGSAFRDCGKIKIEFSKNSALSQIVGDEPTKVTTVGGETEYGDYSYGPFSGCQIDTLILPANLEYLKDCSFGGATVSYLGFESPSKLKKCVSTYNSSYSYSTYKNGAFRFAKIGTLKMPPSFTEVSDYSFNVTGWKTYGSSNPQYYTGSIGKLLLQETSLATVTIPRCKDFKNSKFVSAINEVFLPETVTLIKAIYCNKLYIPRTTPPTIELTFNSNGEYIGPKPELFVPVEGYQAYYDCYGQYMTITSYSF